MKEKGKISEDIKKISEISKWFEKNDFSKLDEALPKIKEANEALQRLQNSVKIVENQLNEFQRDE